MVDAVLPPKQKLLLILLSAEEPVVPFLDLVPVLDRKDGGVELIGPLEILKCENEGWRIAVFDILFHESRAVA